MNPRTHRIGGELLPMKQTIHAALDWAARKDSGRAVLTSSFEAVGRFRRRRDPMGKVQIASLSAHRLDMN